MSSVPVFSFLCQIKGIRLYSGYTEDAAGEKIVFERERTNSHDANAIGAWLGRFKVGHVDRDVARVLSQPINNGWISVDG